MRGALLTHGAARQHRARVLALPAMMACVLTRQAPLRRGARLLALAAMMAGVLTHQAPLRRGARLLALAAMMACAHAAGADYAPAFAPERLSEERVDVAEVVRPAQPGKTYAAVTLIDAPVAKLCAIVQDYAAYPSCMPNTANTQIVSSADERAVIDMTLSLPLGKIKRYRLQLDAKHGGDTCQLSWKLLPRADLAVDDTIADTTGYWLFTPLPANHNKSVVEYFVYADPGPVPFGLGWIVDIMSKKSLPNTLEALRGRAQKP